MPSANLYELYSQFRIPPPLVASEGVCERNLAAQLAAQTRTLREAGLGSGMFLGLVAEPHLGTVLDILAAFCLGAGVALVNPRFPEQRIKACFEQLVSAPMGVTSHHWLLRRDPGQPTIQCGSTVLFTSGSAGVPKPVLLTARSHASSAAAANKNLPLQPGDRWLLSLSLCHVAGIGILHRCFLAGAGVVIPATSNLAESLQDPTITHLSLVPTQLSRLLRQPEMHARLRGMKAILIGGAPCPLPLLRRAYDLGLPLVTSYGMTETASQIAATTPGASLDALNTAGMPLTRDTIAIAPHGEIQVRGRFLFKGYWTRKALVRPFDPDGWFNTGDIGAWDASGRLVIRGRRDNQFQCGGESIQPEEIEQTLRQLPRVADAAVVPLDDPEYGAVPVAYVQLETGEIPDAAALAAALSERLPRHMIPRQFYPWPAAAESASEKTNRQTLIRLANEKASR